MVGLSTVKQALEKDTSQVGRVKRKNETPAMPTRQSKRKKPSTEEGGQGEMESTKAAPPKPKLVIKDPAQPSQEEHFPRMPSPDQTTEVPPTMDLPPATESREEEMPSQEHTKQEEHFEEPSPVQTAEATQVPPKEEEKKEAATEIKKDSNKLKGEEEHKEKTEEVPVTQEMPLVNPFKTVDLMTELPTGVQDLLHDQLKMPPRMHLEDEYFNYGSFMMTTKERRLSGKPISSLSAYQI